nr:hypothetical protein [uncultured Flavobacterium sp.]
MARIFIGFMICLLLLNCTKKEVKKTVENNPYIISKEDRETLEDLKKRKIPPPPPPPGQLFYGTNAFIIDKDSNLYYFQGNKSVLACSTGSENDTIPYFIDLQPKDLIEIPNNCIADFVKLNYKKEIRNLTFITSQLDTLQSKNYFDLIEAIKTSCQDMDTYFIGRTTQEEDTVLKYKKNNESYYFENIKWDKTKIKFPEYMKFAKAKE